MTPFVVPCAFFRGASVSRRRRASVSGERGKPVRVDATALLRARHVSHPKRGPSVNRRKAILRSPVSVVARSTKPRAAGAQQGVLLSLLGERERGRFGEFLKNSLPPKLPTSQMPPAGSAGLGSAGLVFNAETQRRRERRVFESLGEQVHGKIKPRAAQPRAGRAASPRRPRRSRRERPTTRPNLAARQRGQTSRRRRATSPRSGQTSRSVASASGREERGRFGEFLKNSPPPKLPSSQLPPAGSAGPRSGQTSRATAR